MTWGKLGDYALSAAKFIAAAAGVAVMAAFYLLAKNPQAGTRDIVIAIITAVVVWLVPNRPLPSTVPAPAARQFTA